MQGCGILGLVWLLLEVKANHNALDRVGRTLLHVAAANWHSHSNFVEVADLLMDTGSHLNQPDIRGITCLQLFRQMHHRLSAEGLLDPAPNLEDLIHNVVLPLTCYCAQSIRNTEFPSKILFRLLSSLSSKDMANCPWNCFELGAHTE